MDPAPVLGQPQDDDGAKALHGRSTPGHRYENQTARDNSRVHNGDHHGDQHHHYYAAQPGPASASNDQADALKRLQEALCFPQMNFRYTAIQSAYSQTCRWFFETPEYTRWRDRSLRHKHHGLLWMKGKPGAGKSTITKCAVEHAKSNYPDEKIICFFFNARGENLEKSVEGMFRSLLHQMAPDCPRLLDAVQSKALQEYAQRAWPLDLLKTLFRESANQLSEKASLICYIDAIDEGADEDEVRDMIDLLDNLLETTAQDDRALSVYLASRHYPNISISHSEQFVLENNADHRDNIAIYAQSKLRCREAILKEDLIMNITQRSSGVFLWVVLVVRDLNKEIDGGNQHRLQPRLQALPNELNDLFQRVIDESDKDNRLLPALMWVLFAHRSMTPLELYCAILSATEPRINTIVWNRGFVDEATAKRFILSSSKGLLEIAGFSPSAQLIHESLREYLLTFGMQQLDPDLSDNLAGRSNLRLAQWCENHLRSIPRDERLRQIHGSRQSGEDLSRCALRLWPFFEYALSGFLRHYDTAAYHGLDVQLSCRQISLQQLLLMDIQTIQIRRQLLPTPLQVLVAYNHENLVRQHLQHCPSNHLQEYVNNSYLDESYTSIRGTALHLAIRQRNFAILELLLDHGANVNIRCAGCELPLHAVHLGFQIENVLMTRVLIQRGADVDARHDDGSPLLQITIRLNWFRTTEVLLQAGADVKVQSCNGNTALHLAAKNRFQSLETHSAKMVEKLLQHGADPSTRNDEGETALHVAIASPDLGTTEIVETLLRYGADSRGRNNRDDTPLHLVFRHNQDDVWFNEVFETLLRYREGYSAHATALHPDAGRELQDREVVEVLLRYGADPSARSSRGETALHLAAGHVLQRAGVVEILLRHGADPNARNDRGETALHLAAVRRLRPAEVVKILLQHDTKFYARSDQGKTVLHLAVSIETGSDQVFDTLVQYDLLLGDRTEWDPLPLPYALDLASSQPSQHSNLAALRSAYRRFSGLGRTRMVER